MRFRFRKLQHTAIFSVFALAMLSTAAHAAATLPPRKPGLWITTMTMQMAMPSMPSQPGGQTMTSAMCSDAETDAKEMKMMSGDSGKCAKFDLEGSGDTYTMDGTCADPMGGGVMTTHGVITKNSETEFHVVSKTTSSHYSGDMTADSKWTGACPAGVAPGDVGSMQNGQFIKRTNILTAPPAAAAQ